MATKINETKIEQNLLFGHDNPNNTEWKTWFNQSARPVWFRFEAVSKDGLLQNCTYLHGPNLDDIAAPNFWESPHAKRVFTDINWLAVLSSRIGTIPFVGYKIENIRNHQWYSHLLHPDLAEKSPSLWANQSDVGGKQVWAISIWKVLKHLKPSSQYSRSIQSAVPRKARPLKSFRTGRLRARKGMPLATKQASWMLLDTKKFSVEIRGYKASRSIQHIRCTSGLLWSERRHWEFTRSWMVMVKDQGTKNPQMGILDLTSGKA